MRGRFCRCKSAKKGGAGWRRPETVKKYYFLTKGGCGLTAAHAPSAQDGRRVRLQAEKYFLSRTSRLRKRLDFLSPLRRRNSTRSFGKLGAAPDGAALYASTIYFAFGSAMPVFLSVVRKKNSERISEKISAIGNANQMLRSTPVRDSR